MVLLAGANGRLGEINADAGTDGGPFAHAPALGLSHAGPTLGRLYPGELDLIN